MTCLKTGCAVYLESERLYLDSADLHIVSDVVVIHYMTRSYEAENLNYKCDLRVLSRAGDYFLTDRKEGVCVARQTGCVMSPELAEFSREWWPKGGLLFKQETDLLTMEHFHQEICDLFARNNGRTPQEGQIVHEGLDNLLEMYAERVKGGD